MADRPAGLTSAPSRHRQTGPNGRHRAPRRRTGRRILTGTAIAVPVLLAASVGGVLPLQIMRVESTSMTPTLESGDVVVVDRTATQVSRMDVVAAEAPGGALVVKRAVGLGGDSVGIEDGILVVDGVPVCEPGIDPALIDGVYFGPVTVPAGHVFLLGDHRDGSIDSREFGTVPVSSLAGTVTARVLPSPRDLEPARC